jgi:hypothetical protein
VVIENNFTDTLPDVHCSLLELVICEALIQICTIYCVVFF